MHELAFDPPVTILTGLGIPQKIRTVLEAYMFLDNYPPSLRNNSYGVALRACKAALAREIDAKTARAAFHRFAERNLMTLPDGTFSDSVIIADFAKRRGGGSGVPT